MARVLFLGGTGIISSACVVRAIAEGHEVFLLTRGQATRYSVPAGARVLRADWKGDIEAVKAALGHETFDVVCDFIAYNAADIERALGVFAGRCSQYVFISSASCYDRPPKTYPITEDAPLANRHWAYSRDKIAAEEYLRTIAPERGLPYTIVRPSLTYGPATVPLVLGSWQHPWTAIERIKRGAPLIVPGDGTSLWSVTWNEDFAVGFVALFGNPAALGEAYHISTDEVLTWNEIFEAVYEVLEAAPNMVHITSDFLIACNPDWEGTLLGDKAHSMILDNSKIKRAAPAFHCKTSWREGVARSIETLLARPDLQTVDVAHDARYDAALAAYASLGPGR